MSGLDKAGALLVVILWGLNFYFIHLGLLGSVEHLNGLDRER